MIDFFNWLTAILFLFSFAGIFSVFLFYPLAVWGLALFMKKKAVIEQRLRPSVTILVVVRNAEDFIKEKVLNTLSLRYPEDLFEVLFFFLRAFFRQMVLPLFS